MDSRSAIHIICAGAVYMDTIWTSYTHAHTFPEFGQILTAPRVPSFPKEDTKQRAEDVKRRRGGNIANSLEVLASIVSEASVAQPSYQLYMIADLPARKSQDTKNISLSLSSVQLRGPYYEDHQDAACCMIIHSKESDKRTIISHSKLPEMMVDEFFEAMPNLNSGDCTTILWFHFEGRNFQFVQQCIKRLRAKEEKEKGRIMISVECENPLRYGLAEAALGADVVFYSELWVKHARYDDPEDFLREQVSSTHFTREIVCLVCTWGKKGAIAVAFNKSRTTIEWAACSAWFPIDGPQASVVDSVGAGDTFVAGMLFALSTYPDLSLKRKLRYAVEIASRKAHQNGFQGLGMAMRSRSIPTDPVLSPWSDDPCGLGSKKHLTKKT